MNKGQEGPLGEQPDDKYPVIVDNQGTKRCLVQTTRYGKYLGKLELVINDKGQIQSISPESNPILLEDAYALPSISAVSKIVMCYTILQYHCRIDPDLQAKVDEWEQLVLQVTEEKIGFTKIPIVSDRASCWYQECSGGNLMTDAARWYLENKVTVNETWKNSIAATVWHGGALSATDLGISAGKSILVVLNK